MMSTKVLQAKAISQMVRKEILLRVMQTQM